MDKRALLHTVSHRLVRVVAAESTPYALALFAIPRERFSTRIEYREWEAALAEIDASELSVGEWLELEARR
jgi:hypothetical protein